MRHRDGWTEAEDTTPKGDRVLGRVTLVAVAALGLMLAGVGAALAKPKHPRRHHHRPHPLQSHVDHGFAVQLLLPLVLVVLLLLGLVLWRLVKARFETQTTVKTVSNLVVVVVGVVMLVAMKSGYQGSVGWVGMGGLLTAVVAMRTLSQERYLLAAEQDPVSAGRDAFDRSKILRSMSPQPFRWAHRVFALWWIWTFVHHCVSAETSTGLGHHAALFVLPLVLMLTLSPLVAPLLLVGFFVSALFLAVMPGLLWVLSNTAWIVVTTLFMPHDRRTNEKKAHSRTMRDSPWFYLA